jgi:hypothetical protein
VAPGCGVPSGSTTSPADGAEPFGLIRDDEIDVARLAGDQKAVGDDAATTGGGFGVQSEFAEGHSVEDKGTIGGGEDAAAKLPGVGIGEQIHSGAWDGGAGGMRARDR